MGGGWTVRKAGRRARVNWRFGAGAGGGRWGRIGGQDRADSRILVRRDCRRYENRDDHVQRAEAPSAPREAWPRLRRFLALLRPRECDGAPTRPSATGRPRFNLIGHWNDEIVVLAVVSPPGSCGWLESLMHLFLASVGSISRIFCGMVHPPCFREHDQVQARRSKRLKGAISRGQRGNWQQA